MQMPIHRSIPIVWVTLFFACAGTKAQPTNTAKTPTQLKGGLEGSTEDRRVADLDNDGRPEVIKYYKKIPVAGGESRIVLVRQDLDMSQDGKIDIWRIFDDSGQVSKEQWDTDFDGIVDETRYFENGLLLRIERDPQNDGKIDVTRYYKEGLLERKETDTNGDGQPDRFEYFKGQTLDRVGIDTDFDGTVDQWASQE